MAVTLGIKGLTEYRNNIRELTGAAKDQIEMEAVKAAGEVVVTKAKEIVRHLNLIDSGSLYNNIVIEVAKEGKQHNGKFEVHIGVRHGKNKPRASETKDPYYWVFIEFGTSLYIATPFLRPALEDYLDLIIEAFSATYIKGLKRLI